MGAAEVLRSSRDQSASSSFVQTSLLPLAPGLGAKGVRWIASSTLIQELEEGLPDGLRTSYERFARSLVSLAEATALRWDQETNSYYLSNTARGPLLWLLVAHRGAQAVLEIGTGRGFGTLSIFDALQGLGKGGEVDTIDIIPHTGKQPWPRKEGEHTVRTPRSVEEEMSIRIANRDTRVRFHEGISLATVTGKRLASPDLVFIDAGHDEVSVFIDLVATALATKDQAPMPTLLFDDVGGRVGVGVARALEKYLLPYVPPESLTVIDMPTSEIEQRETGHHTMLLVDGGRGAEGLRQAFTKLRAPTTRFRAGGLVVMMRVRRFVGGVLRKLTLRG